MTLAAILAAVLALGGIGAPTQAVQGWATWYDGPSATSAAAGPAVRDMLGRSWRGDWVRVCAGDCVTVRLVDWCACGDRHGQPTVIDLDDQAFRALAPRSRGVITVTVTPVDPGALPATDTE